ncbi:hypothetical protein F5879DRAFT_995882 [Lentinula edodes]|nr:hypothetical protein F5879DRAFT_995882 [Lentinula edodes]
MPVNVVDTSNVGVSDRKVDQPAAAAAWPQIAAASWPRKRDELQKSIKPSSNLTIDQGYSTTGGDFGGSAIQDAPYPEQQLQSKDLGKAISQENFALMQQLECLLMTPDTEIPTAVPSMVQVASSYPNKCMGFIEATPIPAMIVPVAQVASNYSDEYMEFVTTTPTPAAVFPTAPAYYQGYPWNIEQNLRSGDYPSADAYGHTSGFETPNVGQSEPLSQGYHHKHPFQAHGNPYY